MVVVSFKNFLQHILFVCLFVNLEQLRDETGHLLTVHCMSYA